MKAPYQSRAYFDLLGDVDARLGGLTKLAESGDVAQDAANENQGGELLCGDPGCHVGRTTNGTLW